MKAEGLKHLPKTFCLSTLFERKIARSATMSEEERQELELLQGITGKASWSSHTHQGEQEVLANWSILNKARQLGDWALAETAWRSALLPAGHAVVVGDSTTPLFIVRAYKFAALTWPMVRGPHNTFSFDLNAPSLYWLHLTDLESCKVFPLTAQSPLRMARLEDTRNAGICLRAQSEVPVDLLTHHVTTGFLNISEATLRKLAKSQDWSEFGSLSGVPKEMSLVAHCMLNLSPGMLKEDFVDRVLAREQSQKYATDFLEEDMAALIRDTLEPEDQEKALNAVRPDVKDKSLLRDSAGKVFDHAIKRLPKNKRDQGDATRKEFQKQDTKRSREAEKRARNIFAKPTSSADEILKACLPTLGHAYTDQFNGRWRLSYRRPGMSLTRSISWTAVGDRKAAAIAIQQLWGWCKEHNGSCVPEFAQSALDILQK